MIGKLKKIVGTDQEGGGVGVSSALGSIPSGVKVMGAHLQRKFARGVQYNMKVIIKGERGTGKSTLLYRLQGYKFVSEYSATDEIQVAVIHWTAATSAEVVKVDVWDIVDKGKSRKKSTGLKLTNEPAADDNNLIDPCLDADFLDVYQGTHAVVFIFDICKKWTYDYVIKNLPLVPHEIPVLVMANFMDNQENRVIGENTGMRLLRSAANRPLVAAPVVVIESSLKDGFGLKMVHQFFNLPFLSLQRKSLNQMMETNKQNQIKINEFFQGLDANRDCDYGAFLQKVEERRSNKASQSSPDNVLSPSHSAIFNVSSANVSPSRQLPPPNANGQVTDQVKPANTDAPREGIGSKLTRMFSKRQKAPARGASKDSASGQGDNLDNFLNNAAAGDEQNGPGRKGEGENSDEDNNENPMVDHFYEDFASDENHFFEVFEPGKEGKELNKAAAARVKERHISSSSEDEPPAVSKSNDTGGSGKIQASNDEPVDLLIDDVLDPFDDNAAEELMFVTDVSPEHKKTRMLADDSLGGDSSVENQYIPQSKSQTQSKVNKKKESFNSKRASKKSKVRKKKKRAETSSDSDGGNSGGGKSTTTSEGGEVPSDSDFSLPSEDPEGDAQFKKYIRSQVKPNIQLNDVSNAVTKAASKMPPRRNKKNSERNLVSSDEPQSVDEDRSDDESKSKGKSTKGGNRKRSVVQNKVESLIDTGTDDLVFSSSNVNPIVSTTTNDGNNHDDLEMFLAKNLEPEDNKRDSTTTTNPGDHESSGLIPDVDYLPLTEPQPEPLPSSKPLFTPQNTIIGDETEHVDNSLASPTLNLMLDSGELDFLEAVSVEKKPKKKEMPKEVEKEQRKKSKKKTTANDDQSIDSEKTAKKSSKSKNNKTSESKTKKTKSKSEKEFVVLLDFDEPSVDGEILGDNNEDTLNSEASPEKKKSKSKIGSKSKKSSKTGDKTGEKKSRKKVKEEVSSSDATEQGERNREVNTPAMQFHKNDGYESL